MLEIGGYEQLREVIVRDYPMFSGKMLERYFRTKFVEQKSFTRIGGYWDRRGENEIDLVLVNELDKTAEIIEVKRNRAKIDMDKLNEKSLHFRKVVGGDLDNYKISLRGLSMEDM